MNAPPLWYAEGIKVFNNSIWRPDQNWSRGIRVGTGTARPEIMNNLVHGEIRYRKRQPAPLIVRGFRAGW
jgi:hypothetical protein